ADRTMWRLLTPIRIALLLGVVLSALRFSQCRYLDLVDVRAVDYRLIQRGVQPASPEIVVVAVDDASIEQLGRWPWPRAVMAKMVERLTSAQAAVIGFDVVQSEPTEELSVGGLRDAASGVDERTWDAVQGVLRTWSAGDRRLAETIHTSDRVVVGYFFEFGGEVKDASGARFSAYNLVQHSASGRAEAMVPQASGATLNLPEINAAAREAGFFNFRPDSDGAYRRAPLAIRFGDQVALPLSLAMLRVYWRGAQSSIRFAEFGVESVRIGSVTVPVAEDGQMLINYRGPRRTFRHVSAADVLAGHVDPQMLQGKIVLVGVTATAVADIRATPFDGYFPGVEIHANVLDNILRQDFIQQPKGIILVEIPAIMASVLILGVLLHYARGVVGALLAVGLMGAYLVGSQWLFVVYGLPLTLVYPLLAVSLTYAAIGVQHYVTIDREKRKIRNAFSLYLSPSVADLVSERPEMLALGGDTRELTVLFSDIRGFTTISERFQHDPHTLVALLNEFLGGMTDVIFAHDGLLDKYVGDEIMAVWGAPLPQADHAARACRGALDMMKRLAELNEEWKQRGWPPLDIGIGINSGPMVVGNMGSQRRLSYTVVGDNVNLGARLEGLNKLYGSHIIASESTIEAAGDLVVRELDLVRVKGKYQGVRIFEVLGLATDREHWADLVERFNSGVYAYRARRWDEAIHAFAALLDERPDDGPSRLYLGRCRGMLEAPPAPDWDGVTVMEVK
ncbi:MAG TPA: adenylate/guanylate cyclase domain-containing protein, partial [Candidatus Kryptonia bacterium]|nr:adenylate/guanylate cyclase domain-containing protein [Candidatus Kryptonia bacterium]